MKCLFLIFSFVFLRAFGQEYEYDFPPMPPLKGIIDSSFYIIENDDTLYLIEDIPEIEEGKNYWFLNGVDTAKSQYYSNKINGHELLWINSLGCTPPEHWRLSINESISSYNKVNDTIFVNVRLREPCGSEFGGFIDIYSDTLKIFYGTYGRPLECGWCCYTLDLAIKTTSEFNFFFVNQKEFLQSDEPYVTQPIKPWIVNGDTAGYYNKYGMLEGWYHYGQDSITVHRYINFDSEPEIYHTNDLGYRVYEECHSPRKNTLYFEQYDYLYFYNDKGELLYWEESNYDQKFNTIRKIFYPNGKLKRWILEKDYKIFKEEFYNEKGKLIKKKPGSK